MEILTNSHKCDTITEDAGSAAQSFEVTDIKQGVKNPNRANIFINGKFSFSLDITQLVDFKLKIGTRLTAERLAELRQASDFGKLYQRALEWVLTRPRSVKETKDYLLRTSAKKNLFLNNVSEPRSFLSTVPKSESQSRRRELFDESVVKMTTRERAYSEKDFLCIIQKLIDKGYLDDRKFAEYYVENRFVKKGISEKRLKMELLKKGISNQIIDEVLGDSQRDDESEIKKIIAKKRHKYDDDKLTQYLIRQGFDYELARTLVRDSSETDL